jgi:cyclic-di-GMP-binding protein
MPSFDVVSELNGHEVSNGVDQANRELTQRFDFKNTGAEFTRDAKEPFVVVMKAQVEFQLQQMLDILKQRLAKRGVDVKCIEVKDPETNLAEAKQRVVLKHGIDADTGRKVVKLLKDSGLKVQGSIQGDKVRVTGKQRDDLQSAIATLRKADVGVPLQFDNFRE